MFPVVFVAGAAEQNVMRLQFGFGIDLLEGDDC